MKGNIFMNGYLGQGFFGMGKDISHLIKRMKAHGIPVCVLASNVKKAPLLYMSKVGGEWTVFDEEYSLSTVHSIDILNALRLGHSGKSAWSWAFDKTGDSTRAESFKAFKAHRVGLAVYWGY